MTRADELRQLADLIGDEGTVPRLLRNAAKELDALHADIAWRIEQSKAQEATECGQTKTSSAT